MPDLEITLTDLTLAANDMPGMVAFYNAVLAAELQPVEAYGTTLYRGRLGGLGLLLCPNEIAGVQAEQNRHQLRFRVARFEQALARAKAAGGTLRGEVLGEPGKRLAAVVDPDGNTLELSEA
jgi:catechol 2,3-dioxygenase-like lactoylglutathione lyase family enzyme